MITEDEKQQIKDAIDQCPLSMRGAAEVAGLPYRTFIYRAQVAGIYKPNQGGKDRTFPNGGKNSIPLEEILDGKHPSYRSNALKIRMLKENLIDKICEWCGIENDWNGKPIVLELDHKNGINSDHKRDNLRLLCPNCHSQTPTFRGRKGPVVESADTLV